MAGSSREIMLATMLGTMAEMQDAHNVQVHPQWREQGYAYYRAIWVECAELLDHFGWKWWKHQMPDVAQVKLEIVDIFHFGLSHLLRADALSPEVAEKLDIEPAGNDGEALRLAVERLAQTTLANQGFDVGAFADVMRHAALGFDELYRMYVGKNVLNHFRQDHGYKTGTYRKLWQGREDNEHLVELLDALDTGSADAPRVLYAALSERYQTTD